MDNASFTQLKSQPLSRIESVDTAIIRHCIQQRVPALVRGLTDRWPARQWTFEWLVQTLQRKEVRVLIDTPQDSGEFRDSQEAHERTMAFADFIELALRTDRPPSYLAYQRADELLPDLHVYTDFASLTGPSAETTDTRLWIGSAGTCSGLHSDLKDNVFAQLYGSKVVYLVSFAESHLVYPYLDNLVNSQVRPEAYDPRQFPAFARATVHRCIVSPGDVLFIPRGWWHYLRSESPSISINHWFGPPVSTAEYLALLLRLGPSFIVRSIVDMVRYPVFGTKYQRRFFFSPAATGERLYNLLRFGDFSKENDPSA